MRCMPVCRTRRPCFASFQRALSVCTSQLLGVFASRQRSLCFTLALLLLRACVAHVPQQVIELPSTCFVFFQPPTTTISDIFQHTTPIRNVRATHTHRTMASPSSQLMPGGQNPPAPAPPSPSARSEQEPDEPSFVHAEVDWKSEEVFTRRLAVSDAKLYRRCCQRCAYHIGKPTCEFLKTAPTRI